jgi:hypothetical protein
MPLAHPHTFTHLRMAEGQVLHTVIPAFTLITVFQFQSAECGEVGE